MKTETKYYTPSIEEFHVGFEYEIKLNNGNWETHEFKPNIDNFCHRFKEETYFVEEGNSRVKHLDREDLEELGWAYKEQSNVNNFIFERVNDSFTRLSISYGEPCSISIYRYGSDDLVPKAYIKNKSELRKLMVQLGLE